MIYLDNAATTQVSYEVFDKMKPFFLDNYSNPSAIYSFAGKTMRAVDAARDQIADALGAKSNEIYFTAGGSESDNWALKSVLETNTDKGRHIITSKIEHHAILHTCEYLKKQGYEVTYVGVDENGLVKLEDIKAAIRPDTVLVSIMAANNEIGTIEPIKEIGALCHEKGILFHTDAVQTFGHIPMNVDELNIDLLSASGHKFHAPKGIGFLYIRRGVKIASFVHGGAQERNRRAGTLNTPGIVGIGEATRLAVLHMDENVEKMKTLRDHLIHRVLNEIPHSKLNGDPVNRLPGNANFSIPGVEGETMLILLDQRGICASSGSACTSGSVDPSHVLLEIGLSRELAKGSLRLTLSEMTTKEEIDETVEQLKTVVEKLRSMSPLYEEYLKKNME